MAQNPTPRLGKNQLDLLLRYVQAIMDVHKRNTELHIKLEHIDVAYARYKFIQGQTGGVDTTSATTHCGINLEEITVPVVVSQVDTYVGYLADIFLSGYPLFPVVSTPDSMKEAEAFQSIIEDHAMRGRYARQFLMNFYDGVKYNLTAAEIAWYQQDTYSYPDALESLSGRGGPQPQGLSINQIKRLDPYNLIYDRRVEPVDVPYAGTYAGYVEAIPEIDLKRKLLRYNTTGFGYNTNVAFNKGYGAIAAPFAIGHYKEKPQISNIIARQSLQNASLTDWDAFMLGDKYRRQSRGDYSDMFVHTTLYCRIIPSAVGISGPNSDRPQVWKLCVVNDHYIVHAMRIFTIYDMLPIIIGQPREDGFGIQTNSIGENGIDFQEGASKLFGIRLSSARRAVMDRAIYDPEMINSSHLNSPMPAPKIPLRDRSAIAGKTIEQAYKQIPFDSRGTETVINDLATVLSLADQVNGTNKPTQGQFQRGNKTRREWTDTMEGAYNRLRLPALCFEMQFFTPLKEQIKLNIFQNSGEVEGTYQNPGNGDLYEVDAQMIEQIRKKVHKFQVADGFHPAEKIASGDILQFGFQTIQNSPQLQASYGPALPYIFAHMMQLGGVKGFDQYTQMAQRLMQQSPNGQQPVTPAPTAPA